MAALHFFNPKIAEKYGLNAAILLEFIGFWIEKNKANDVHYHDGLYWTYNSKKALAELFPYMSTKAIRTAMDVLKDNGLIVTGNYNSSAYDRTLWYALTEKGQEELQKGQMELPEMNDNEQKGQMHLPCRANGIAPEGKPIPVNIPVNNISSLSQVSDKSDTFKRYDVGARAKARSTPPTIEEVRAYCEDRGNNIDAERFIDYYEQQGWRLSNGNPLKDWRAAVRNWERRDRNATAAGNSKPASKYNFTGIPLD